MPTSWFTQSATFPPIEASFSPAALPAVYSSCPTCSRAPSFFATSEPEFIEITGIPAATAFSIDGPSASASGIETTSPSGSWFTAASISLPSSSRRTTSFTLPLRGTAVPSVKTG